jgi:hypothetical protein
MNIARTITFGAVLLAIHAAMWCAVPFIPDGSLLPSDTFSHRLLNVAFMTAWLWAPLAALVMWERHYLQ